MNLLASNPIHVTSRNRNKKVQLFMRYSILYSMILFIGTQVLFAAPGNSQGIRDVFVSLELKNEPLAAGFKKIEGQTNYLFAYQPTMVDRYEKITLSKARRTLEETLTLLLSNTDLTYKVSNTSIIITKKAAKELNAELEKNARFQDVPIKGRVLNEKGEPVSGASVTIKNSNKGTTTNNNGEFTIEVENENAVLVVSFVGYESYEVALNGKRDLTVNLLLNQNNLGEVVVTSFGVKQNKRNLGYAVQNVRSKDISESRQPNVVNSLQGKVAGLQITNSSGVPGASADIVLRGGTSLDGNNSPLFVIDGIPMDNSTIAEPPNGGGQLARTVANSNRALDLNPEDIESITVLKGPTAASLYGLRAASGAIIITTKKGAAGTAKINFSTNFEVQEVNKLPEFQDRFKMGTGGASVPSRLSWGPEFAAGEQRFDNMKNFFQPGTLATHNLSFTGGTQQAAIFASVSRTDQKGIVPESDFKRTSFRINADANLVKNLKIGFTSNYINSNGTRPLQGPGVLNGTGGVMASIVYWPLNDDMSNYLNADGSRRRLIPNINQDIDNPYWSVKNNPVTNNVNRFIGTTQLAFDPLSWLNVTYRIGTDFYKENTRSVRSPGTSLQGNGNGGLAETDNFNQITTSTLLATIKKQLFKDFSASLLLGHNVEWNEYRSNSVFGTGFINPDFVGINNTSNRNANQVLSRKRIIGAFGDLQLSYKNFAFVSLTGRNDWSSTLPVDNRSFFYPSIGGSLIVSELLQLNSKVLNYAKLRGTYAKVGKDAPPHKLGTTLETVNYIVLGGGFGYGFFSNNAALRPEFTNSTEFGAEVQLLNRRLGFDVSWYKIESKDQITQPRVSQGTGFIFKLVNGGTIVNKGLEVSINAIPVKTQTFTWDLQLNWSRNRATVTELPVGTSVFRNSDAIAVFNLAEGASFLNGDFYAIRGSKYLTNDKGQLVIGANGYPIVNKSIQSDLGVSRQPDWISGLTNSFTYKSINLSFLIDIRKGGAVFNGTEYELVKSGLSTRTLDRDKTMVLPGVTAGGAPNTQSVLLDQNYYTNIYAEHAPNFIEDGGWYRLRYISLNYNLPARVVSKTPFRSLSLNVTGKNLILITDYTGIDPETSIGGAGVKGTGTVGIDYLGFPSTKGVSFGLNVGF